MSDFKYKYTMKHRTFLLFLCSIVIHVAVGQPRITLDVNKKGVAVSPVHYGIFFEDINHAADGGLYAELIRNRSFEDATTPDAWTTFKTSNGVALAAVDSTELLNSVQKHSLRLFLLCPSSTVRAGIYNTGYWGINAVKDRQYTISFYAKRDTIYKGGLIASLESLTGVKYAEVTVNSLTTGWTKYNLTFTSNANDPNARFVLSGNSTGTVWLDMVSLFPPTFKNRENGLRPDLAQMLADLHPKFLRFPGGCFVEGDYLANRFQWKKTIGKTEERPGHKNLWGYRTSDGLGYHEYLQMCEDLGAEPLYVTNVGLAHNDYQSSSDIGAYIQDVMDAIEYANGAVTTAYGALRAVNGHPEPFNLKYLEIGNENYYGNNYGSRYSQFYAAIKSKYPNMQCIGNVAAWGTDTPSWPFSYPVQLLDEHYYRSPQWFINQYAKYDTYSRSGPGIYVGEYAVTSGCGNGNLIAAIGEAAFMAGMEKNTDVVKMNSYAPIFVNVNDRAWNPDMIVFNSAESFGTPSYYVQKMFANNVGTVTIPVNDTLNIKTSPLTGAIGVGTWATQADYADLKVTDKNGNTLFSDNFSNSDNWNAISGTWLASGNMYSQTASTTDCRSMGYAVKDSLYTYTLKARKTGGSEGFLIIVGYKDLNNFYWLNLGGWGNTQHGIEACVDGTKTVLAQVNGTITTNVWYDIKIEVTSTRMRCYLNNVLIHDIAIPTALKLYTSATLDEASGKLYLKVVNPANSMIPASMVIKGCKNEKLSGTSTVLAGADPLQENSLTNKTALMPRETDLSVDATGFNYVFDANSVTVFALNTSGLNGNLELVDDLSTIKVAPNPVGDYLFVKTPMGTFLNVKIRDVEGKTLMSFNKTLQRKFNVSALKKGLYIVDIEHNDINSQIKIIKD